MAKLTAKKRDNLPKSKFAIPSKNAYPVDTKARAKNALSRVAQNGTPAEKAAVRKKVAAEYPDIAQSKGPMSKKTGPKRKKKGK